MKRVGYNRSGDKGVKHIRAARLGWVYLVLMIAMAMVITDRHLLPDMAISTITAAEQTKVETRSGGHTTITYWTVVDLSDGTRFQTQAVAGVFPIGDTLEVRQSALFGHTTAYRNLRRGGSWVVLEASEEGFEGFPYLVLACCLLLLMPWWSEDNRLFLMGVLGVTAVAWIIMMLGTGGLLLFK